MTSTGTAPAPTTRAVPIGPLSTQAGFQYWYLACYPDCIIAVRQSISAFFAFGLSGGAVPPIFGLLGGLINVAARSSGKKMRERVEATLSGTPSGRLRVKGNVVYQASQLNSISFKPFKGGGNLILPDVIFETRNGKQKYGMQPADFDKACVLLKQLYPGLCK